MVALIVVVVLVILLGAGISAGIDVVGHYRRRQREAAMERHPTRRRSR